MFLSTRYALTLFPGKTFYPSSMGVHPSTEKRYSSPVPCGSGRCSLGLCHSRNINCFPLIGSARRDMFHISRSPHLSRTFARIVPRSAGMLMGNGGVERCIAALPLMTWVVDKYVEGFLWPSTYSTSLILSFHPAHPDIRSLPKCLLACSPSS